MESIVAAEQVCLRAHRMQLHENTSRCFARLSVEIPAVYENSAVRHQDSMDKLLGKYLHT